MIISKTPYRISLFGGGSDYPEWYQRYPGKVISFTVNKFSYLMVRELPPFFENKFRINYSKLELVDQINQIKHPAIREALNIYMSNKFIELHHIGELPANSGMGSSSTFAVGLINALNGLNGRILGKELLTNLAIEFEQRVLNENVGSQDQIACVFGGLNVISFGQNWKVIPVDIPKTRILELNEFIIPIYSKVKRSSSDISSCLTTNMLDSKELVFKNIELVDQCKSILESNKSLESIGELLNENWRIKKLLNPLSVNDKLEEMYQVGMKNGALGAKVLGAGGGGFMLFWVPPKFRDSFLSKMQHGIFIPMSISFESAKLIQTV